MSALMHPVGPRPARVYWIRRVLVVSVSVGLIALLIVAGRIFFGGGPGAEIAAGAGDTTAAADGVGDDAVSVDEASDEAEPAAAADDSSEGPTACDAQTLTVALTPDQQSYSVGQNPVFTVTTTNTSPSSCTIEAGESDHEVVIMSGDDRIWSSADCPSDAQDSQLLLLPSGGRDESTVTWPQVRSDPQCTSGLGDARPGTYTVTATVAGVSSTALVFQITD